MHIRSISYHKNVNKERQVMQGMCLLILRYLTMAIRIPRRTLNLEYGGSSKQLRFYIFPGILITSFMYCLTKNLDPGDPQKHVPLPGSIPLSDKKGICPRIKKQYQTETGTCSNKAERHKYKSINCLGRHLALCTSTQNVPSLLT